MLALGLLARRRRPRYAVGWILYAAGVRLVHRHPCRLGSVPAPGAARAADPHLPRATIIPGSRVERLAIATAYAYAIAYPVANDNVATIAFAVGIVGLAAWRYLAGRVCQRRARAGALIAALAFGSALTVAAVLRLGGS